MSDENKDEKKIEPEPVQKERDYFQKPALPANPEKTISDTSGSSWSGERWSGRGWGGGRD
jgi:hypothetical protein